jgi:hypothetical protein
MPAATDEWVRLGAAAAAGALVALVLVIVLQAIRLLPVPGSAAVTQATERAQSAGDAVAALDRRIVAMEAMTADLPRLRADVDKFAAATSAAETSIESLASKATVANGRRTAAARLPVTSI